MSILNKFDLTFNTIPFTSVMRFGFEYLVDNGRREPNITFMKNMVRVSRKSFKQVPGTTSEAHSC